MKICPNCNNQLPDDAEFCRQCGTALPKEENASPDAQKPAAPPQAPVAAPEPPKKKQPLLTAIIILLCLLILAVIFLAFALLSQKNESETQDSDITTTVSEEATASSTTEVTTTTTVTTTVTEASTEAPTEAPAQNVQEVTPQEPVQQQTYTAYFSQDELIQASVGGLSAHEAGILITNLSCDNGTASCSYAPYESYDFVDSITVSGASAGTVTISGTATSIGFDMYDGQSISYESASVPFTITKVVG